MCIHQLLTRAGCVVIPYTNTHTENIERLASFVNLFIVIETPKYHHEFFAAC